MTKSEKYRKLLLISGVLVLLLILAAGISNIQMQTGNPFPFTWQQAPPGESTPLGNGNWILVFIRGVLILCAISIPIYVFINLLTPAGRRRLLKGVIQLAVILVIFYFLSRLVESGNKEEPKQVDQPTLETGGGLPLTDGVPETPVAETSTSSPWLDAGICIGLAAILAIMITVLAWGIYRASREAAGDAMSRLADQAQDAIDALHAGGNIRDTVIRCYIQMTQVLAEERNVRREEAMTPHEFEQILLTRLKLPEAPVRRLTGLFEAVRYGDYHPGKREEMEAIDSLSAIAAACKIGTTGS
jgi:hypothetical protein